MSTVHRLPVLYIYACVYAILLSTVLHRLGIQLLKTARGAQKCWKAIASLLSCYGDHQNCGPGRDWFEFNMEVLKL